MISNERNYPVGTIIRRDDNSIAWKVIGESLENPQVSIIEVVSIDLNQHPAYGMGHAFLFQTA